MAQEIIGRQKGQTDLVIDRRDREALFRNVTKTKKIV